MRSLWLGVLVFVSFSGLACGSDEGSDSGGAGGSGGSGGTAGSGGGAGTGGSAAAGNGGSAGSSGSGGAAGSGGSGGTAGSAGSGGSGGTAGSAGSGGSPPPGDAAAVAAKLGRTAHFLIGMGNDLAGSEHNYDHNYDGAYTLPVSLDIHYAYLVGLPGEGGWPDWNSGGSFVNILTDVADAQGVVPMFTMYSMAAWGEANSAVLTNDAYMGPYWQQAKLLFERLALFDKPAIVHFEPDWWGYAHQASGGDPTQLATHVGTLIDACSGMPENQVGMGQCLVHLARTIAPKVVIGFHASRWADPDPAATAAFMVKVGAADADILVIETLDRDAGCFEEHTDPNCQRNDGPWYWDAENQSSPNFSEHLAWAKAVSLGVGRPLLWWQMPFGVPSDTPGGSAGHYRDNRVKYLFEHPQEFVAAGGLGAVFGTGAGNQTYITSDGGQFADAVTGYFSNPTPL